MLALQDNSQNVNAARGSSSGRQELSLQEPSKVFRYQQPLLLKEKHSKLSKFAKKAEYQSYLKETVYIQLHCQTWIPTTEDRIHLPRIGLGMKKLIFDVEGDA